MLHFFSGVLELSGVFWPRGPLKWFDLANVSVIGGYKLSSDFYEKKQPRFKGRSKTVQVTGSSSYLDYTVHTRHIY